MLRTIVQFVIDYPVFIAVFLVGSIALTIAVALFNQWLDDRKTDKNLPSYMKAYDRHGNRIRRK